MSILIIHRWNLIPNLLKNNLLQGGLVFFYELLLFYRIINPDFTLKKLNYVSSMITFFVD